MEDDIAVMQSNKNPSKKAHANANKKVANTTSGRQAPM